MNDKETISSEETEKRGYDPDVGSADQPLETIIERLPTQYKSEILKQYDLPKVKVSILTIFRYGTPTEYVMQVIGLFFAVAAGNPHTISLREWY